MNDNIYIDQISLLLSAFTLQVKRLGKLNLQDNSVNAEYFFRDFINVLKGWNLVNANDLKRNESGIDLVDETNKVIIQVSSSATKDKVQSSIDKTDTTKYNGYSLYFLFIVESASNLKTKDYTIPSEFTFDPTSNIWDINDILAKTQSGNISIKEKLYELTNRHLHPIYEPAHNATSLANVVDVLARTMESSEEPIYQESFLIEQKILVNKLDAVRDTIKDHVIYTSMLNHIYESSESCCRFARRSIHSSLRKVYEDNKAKMTSECLYRHIFDHAYSVVLNSSNCPKSMMIDDIAWCVDIIVADAFEACKIFEHPNKS